VCPITTGALMQLSSQLRADGLHGRVVVAEVTVDPWHDSTARLRAYRRLTGLDFELLTGTPSEIHRFWRYFGVYYKRVPESNPPAIDWYTHKPETFNVEHSDNLIYLGRDGKVVFKHIGQYESEATLDEDIAHYALGR
jgi:cytochrome oxidase Cu insertion factor (SCO1/SenC/PrrC family)